MTLTSSSLPSDTSSTRRAGVRGQGSEVRGQGSGVRGQRSEVRVGCRAASLPCSETRLSDKILILTVDVRSVSRVKK